MEADAHPLPGGGAYAIRDGVAVRVARPSFAPGPTRPALPHLLVPPPRRPAIRMEVLRLAVGPAVLALPATLAHRIHPMPDRLAAAGMGRAGLLGFAVLGGVAMPVLDTARIAGGAAGPLRHAVELRVDGRSIALAAERVEAGAGDARVLRAWLSSPEGTAVLALAPRCVADVPAVQAPQRHFVVVGVGGTTAALPVGGVAVVLAPQQPARTPMGLVGQHAGHILPVVDASLKLAGAASSWPAPMLLLRTRPAFLLAVGSVAGVRAAPEGAFAPVGDGGLIAGLVVLGGDAVPILDPHAAGWHG